MNIFYKTFFKDRDVPYLFSQCMNLKQCYQLMHIYPFEVDHVDFVTYFLERGHTQNLKCYIESTSHSEGLYALNVQPYSFAKRSLFLLLRNEIFFDKYISAMKDYIFKNYHYDIDILFLFMDSPKLLKLFGYELFVQVKLQGVLNGDWTVYHDFRNMIYEKYGEWESPYEIIQDFRDTKMYGDTAKIRNGARRCIRELKKEIQLIKNELNNYLCYDLSNEIHQFLLQ